MKIKVEKNVLLSEHTTLKVGGPADFFVVVETVEELAEGLLFAKQTATLPLILGGGSNVLVSDEGYRGVVILNQIKSKSYDIDGEKVLLTCGAGEVFDEIVKESVEKNYWGLENLSAIPGSVGATPIQNVGAYGKEVSSLIISVTAINLKSFEIKTFNNTECKFDYRDSFFKSEAGRKWVVTEVVFELSKSPSPILTYGALEDMVSLENITPEQVRNKVYEIRSGKFPDWKTVGTAGSFFKNPIVSHEDFQALQAKYPDIVGHAVDDDRTKVSLGWVLDNICNLKGFCQEGVCLYKDQALVLINESSKSAKTIDKFATFVADNVEEKTGIKIEREVRCV